MALLYAPRIRIVCANLAALPRTLAVGALVMLRKRPGQRTLVHEWAVDPAAVMSGHGVRP